MFSCKNVNIAYFIEFEADDWVADWGWINMNCAGHLDVKGILSVSNRLAPIS